jgi:hypothetical protein
VGDLVDELFADYINRLGCPVPVKRTGQSHYMFGTKKVSAKIINGRLVIRVGGGYMGIEEFMMYYGQQELQKIHKEEQAATMLMQDDLDSMENDEDITRAIKRSKEVDVNRLQKQIRDQQAEKVMQEEHKNKIRKGMRSPRGTENSSQEEQSKY